MVLADSKALHYVRSGAQSLAQARNLPDLLASLSEAEVAGLPWLWEFWAMPHQLPPEGDWRTWVIMGGRGAGKTRAGAEWVRAQVEGPRPRDPGRCKRVALVADTIDQAREVMVMGESGLLACSPPDRRPTWIATRRMLEWPNGATAQLFSAHDPEGLRGPQFDCAWADELAKWRGGEEAWDMLQFGLRLGDDPRSVVTTTPRRSGALTAILDQPSAVTTHATTQANRAHLARGFVEEVERRYAGTAQGRQEIEGLIPDDEEGALWTRAMLDGIRTDAVPDFDRIVVGVDPAVAAGTKGDSTGIVVVGARTRGPTESWQAVVLEDATLPSGSSSDWAEAALAARLRWNADRIVAEANQGGDMVRRVMHGLDPTAPITLVHAAQSKALRAEPVAALYERGRVRHLKGLRDLEDQMARMTREGYRGRGSPDRLDALVWALNDALVEPLARHRDPRLRSL